MSKSPQKTHLDALEGYVFIVTYGRSGSTLLQNLLNHIDGYCIRGENNNALFHIARAWDAVAAAEQMRGQRAALEASGTTTAPDHPWYGAEEVDPDELGRALAEGVLRTVLRPPAGTRIAGFKEIRFHRDPAFFLRYMAFLRRFFPNSRFVFNTRDHAAVARSGWWAEQDAAKVKTILERAEKLYDKHIATHPKRSLRLRYEDYNGNPEGLRPLFDFLGEYWDGALVERVLAQRLEHLKGGVGQAGTAQK